MYCSGKFWTDIHTIQYDVATYMMWDLVGCRAIDTMVSLRCPHAVSANSSSHRASQTPLESKGELPERVAVGVGALAGYS